MANFSPSATRAWWLLAEPATPARAGCVLLIIAGVVGLALADG
jgi:multidrug transporter EmrE-like cation transporter